MFLYIKAPLTLDHSEIKNTHMHTTHHHKAKSRKRAMQHDRTGFQFSSFYILVTMLPNTKWVTKLM